MRIMLVLIALILWVLASNAYPDSDLAVTVSDSPDPVAMGIALTYTIVAVNNGPAVADNVILTDTLPSGTTFQSIKAPETWTCTPPSDAAGSLSCTKSHVESGETSLFTIVVIPDSAGLITNTANITASAPDPNTLNNSSAEQTTVLAIDPHGEDQPPER